MAPSFSFDESEFYWILIMDIIYNVYYRLNMHSCVHVVHDYDSCSSCYYEFKLLCVHVFNYYAFMYYAFMILCVQVLCICMCVHVFMLSCYYGFMLLWLRSNGHYMIYVYHMFMHGTIMRQNKAFHAFMFMFLTQIYL